MPTARVYIDALNLYYGALKGTEYRWLDLEALSDRLLPHFSVDRIVYCTAMVKPKPHNLDAGQHQAEYIRVLNQLPRVEVIKGTFKVRETYMARVSEQSCQCCNGPTTGYCLCCGYPTVKVSKTEEKGSDVNVAVQLVKDGLQGNFDTALVISNDSDIQPAVDVVRAAGRRVITANPRGTKHSALVGDEKRNIRNAALAASQLANPFAMPSGQSVHAPTGWTSATPKPAAN
ncbi:MULTISPECIES: NYN domain-containing protein [Dermacoccus]|uniref:NYN domain-containing protein n=2 Tax=Dermacoccus TaxID=57495 RepID=A0A417Z952_9MICO|nr:NYN domain-containing protein [Dermacoccus abyssi]RHW47173.1 NYN domain-containing protein [Dermacoccus abyssi]